MIYVGDCLEVMPTLPENSVDSIITDPPYGLDFMGKEWDHGVPGVEFWRAALRVAKPGAILMAFGGTRTFHRLACAIEDAGWEMRDCMMFLYGVGFPKSLQFGCKCKGADDVAQVSDMRKDVLPVAQCGCEGDGTFLQSSVQRRSQGSGVGNLRTFGKSGMDSGLTGERQSEDERSSQSRLEGRGDVLQDARELQDGQVCSMPEGVPADGSQGRVCDGASPDNGNSPRSLSETDRGCSSSESRSKGQPTREPRTVPKQPGAQSRRGGICPKCGGVIDFRGYGSALKPAWEPIIVAMKPLEGTYAENAQKWGMAGLNIDGARIITGETIENHSRSAVAAVSKGKYGDSCEQETHQTAGQAIGRWPANLLLDEEAARLLDEQSGFSSSSSFRPADKGGTGNCYTVPHPNGGIRGHEDSGGASRFFYTAKASSSERNAGLEDMELCEPEVVAPGLVNTTAKSGVQQRFPRQNFHPTVKPVDLMRYLCKLTRTPTGGIVLDPFMGSGTTGIACVLEHRDFIGIELDERYAEIARKRIADMEGPLFQMAVTE